MTASFVTDTHVFCCVFPNVVVNRITSFPGTKLPVIETSQVLVVPLNPGFCGRLSGIEMCFKAAFGLN